ncbi:protein neuralized [Episyrphus balteatus]|uniref:protein neuralized n=1 Tax=Episyrphus balteatus TaxID=286459 RepID=UPI0024859D8E|nr:protein neuralized [Episyrphus balteatus]
MDMTVEESKDKIIKKKRNQILKRIKKHLGIARRESHTCSNQNNLPPLQFHSVHGDNIRISRDGTQARRFESFCRALTFSSRPVRINERICMRFSEISNNWNGGVRFGFTSNDPASLENSLPKYACPDLTNRPGFWAKALHEQYCELDNILHYYVNSAGDVIYGINGEEKGIILTGIDVRGLLWTVIDIYGNCTVVELLDARLCQQQSSTNAFPSNQISQSNNSINSLMTPMQSLSVLDNKANLPQLQYHISNKLVPLPFHTARGRNIRFSSDNLVATRTENDFCQGYVFTSRPIQTDETIVIQILKTDHTYVGSLALGLTSCNPASLNQNDLPDDSNFLLDRPEYWVVNKDIALPSNKGDEISLCISAMGEVTIRKNCGTPIVLMHVDHRLRLWAFFDVYGSTRSVRVFRQIFQNLHPQVKLPLQVDGGVAAMAHRTNTSADSINTLISHSSSLVNHPLSSSASTTSMNVNKLLHSSELLGSLKASLNSATLDGNISMPTVGQIYLPSSSSDMIQVQPGGTVLVVNLPPTTSRANEFDYSSEDVKKHNQPTSTYSSNPNVSSFKNKSIEANLFMGPQTNTTNFNQNLEEKKTDKELPVSECTICYEKNIDSVLYMCGHMCMCYECAIEQWRGAGCGQCPLCRAVIRDVIRTYTT